MKIRQNLYKGVFAVASLALASVSTAEHSTAEAVKLVTGNGYMPYADSDLKGGGVFTVLVREIYEHMGHDPEIDFKPWKRGASLVVNGKRLATFPLVKGEERLKKFYFSEPVMSPKLSPFVPKANAGSIDELADFKGKTGCLPTGWTSGSKKFEQMEKDGEVEMVSSRAIKHCFRMLKAGRVDFVPTEEPNGNFAAQQVYGSTDKVNFEDYVLSTSYLHVVFAKNEQGKQARDAFNEALEDMRNSGRLEEMKEEYLSEVM